MTIFYLVGLAHRNFSIRDSIRFDVKLVEDSFPLVHRDGGGGVGGEGVGSRNGPSEHAGAERVAADCFLPHKFGSFLPAQCRSS